MSFRNLQTLTAVILWGIIVMVSFYGRLQNFKNTEYMTIDEDIYFHLGQQLKNNISDYNTVRYRKFLIAEGKKTPEYLSRPLYKHPPLFSLLISFSMRIFGESRLAAEYVSLFCGILMIPLVYLLGCLVFNQKAGLMAAALFSMDPISIICSQKVWMDTTIAFFTLVSAIFFICGLKRRGNFFFILSGLSAGLAANTKYTGIIIIFAIFLLAGLYRRELFTNRKFIISLILPFAMLIPWLYWNYKIYGSKFLDVLVRIHSPSPHFIHDLLYHLILMTFGASIVILWIRRNRDVFKKLRRHNHHVLGRAKKRLGIGILIAGGLIIFALYYPQLIAIVLPNHLPATSWSPIFYGAPYTFYPKRLLEFSLLYVFSFVALCIPMGKNQDASVIFVRLFPLVILIFFSLWKSYQSRYIVSSIPFLILLASDLVIRISTRISDMESFPLQISLKTTLILFWVYAILKTVYINIFISFPNNLCYF